jgi:hypothetical protein
MEEVVVMDVVVGAGTSVRSLGFWESETKMMMLTLK